MRYRNPKTLEVFEDIKIALKDFCNGNSAEQCFAHGCPFDSKARGNGGCLKWAEKNPVEAARLMGYEVLDETPTDTPTAVDDTPTGNVDTPTGELVKQKPRLAEVLGVEVGERFMVKSIGVRFFVDKDGIPKIFDGDSGLDVEGISIYYAINHPESIIHLQRLTEPEIAIMRSLGAKWVSRDDNCDDGNVDLWGAKPLYGDGMYNNTEDGGLIATIRSSALFPSVKPGDCIAVENS